MSGRAEWRRHINRIAEQHGCTVEPTRGGHLRIRHMNGKSTTVSATPSDKRALLNVRADVRRLARGAA